jgi:hypothetical protein
MGSNCINLITALPRIDLTDRDFSDCVMPHAYLYKRDLTGSKNLRGVFLIIILIILESKISFDIANIEINLDEIYAQELF